MPEENEKPEMRESGMDEEGNEVFVKQSDLETFEKVLEEQDEENMSGMTKEEIRDRNIMMLLLKIKNGTPPIRKQAMKTLIEQAHSFGAGPLMD